MYESKAYSATSQRSPLAITRIPRRDPTDRDVQIEILFCGICLRLGADEVVVSRNANEMERHAETFDFILDTVSAEHDMNSYLNLLARDGNITLVGAPPQPLKVAAFSLIAGRRSLSGSAIGGIRETQEMLDFCGEHNITSDVEVIPIQKINEAYDRLAKSDVRYRFSIDMASLTDE
jgi:uncharacterized zinc-type alcohol dehydrogenase-like protein